MSLVGIGFADLSHPEDNIVEEVIIGLVVALALVASMEPRNRAELNDLAAMDARVRAQPVEVVADR